MATFCMNELEIFLRLPDIYSDMYVILRALKLNHRQINILQPFIVLLNDF